MSTGATNKCQLLLSLLVNVHLIFGEQGNNVLAIADSAVDFVGDRLIKSDAAITCDR